MSNNIQLYKGDIPENLELSNLLAIDCEFMGLNVRRDPLCLIQISSGNSDAQIVQFDRKEYKAPNLIKIFKNENIKNIPYTIAIVGNKEKIDMEALASFGRLIEVDKKDIFN